MLTYRIQQSTTIHDNDTSSHTSEWNSRFSLSEDDESLSCKKTKWVYTEMVKLNNKLCTMRLVCFAHRVRLSIGSRKVVLCDVLLLHTVHNWPRQFVAINRLTHASQARHLDEYFFFVFGFAHDALRWILGIFISVGRRVPEVALMWQLLVAFRTLIRISCACVSHCESRHMKYLWDLNGNEIITSVKQFFSHCILCERVLLLL